MILIGWIGLDDDYIVFLPPIMLNMALLSSAVTILYDTKIQIEIMSASNLCLV